MPESKELGNPGLPTTNLHREAGLPKRPAAKAQSVKDFERKTNALIKLLVLGSLALTFLCSALALLFGILFVDQPFGDQAPNDKSIFAILTPLMIFLPTVLGHYLQSSESKKDPGDDAS
jgi:hypothetical protein